MEQRRATRDQSSRPMLQMGIVVTLYGCIAVAAASHGVAVVSHDPNTQHWAQSLIAAFIGMTRGGSGGA